jgi:hypothetical protein
MKLMRIKGGGVSGGYKMEKAGSFDLCVLVICLVVFVNTWLTTVFLINSLTDLVRQKRRKR